VETVANVAERLGVSRAQVGLAWLLHQPVVTAPIVGVTRLTHLTDAIAAVDLELSSEDLAELGAGYRPHPVSGHA
jgi:aryl-alcohol dehydrogenase (NADP+)